MTQLKKGVLELCVLALLEQRDRYGYELVTLISEEIQVTVGTIYPLLKRIKDMGWVETQTVESNDGPARKYYRLTEKGREVLAQQIGEWRSFTEKVNRMIGGTKA